MMANIDLLTYLLLDSNTTNFVKDIFIIPTEDIHKNQHLDTKSSSDFEK